ncbi:uncharacterized protein C8R40DRAFT_689629 [Lentinula edodes]|uniref:uncharacterized protein n=1 Tax=Lentinula edodes TaxID=5353 RepID=UPI001E8DFD17|nr:uncharacterized protein C8R40DRAFT_689629 [Lentinula edodes]KAH7878939.1 hypothetical protein C8R40DRAFT_689629 [Lentinula edodes]
MKKVTFCYQTLAEATAIAEKYHRSKAVSTRMTEFQGMFSKTVIIKLEDESEWVVQLRDNEIDTTKVALARSKLGDVVPFVHRASPLKAHFAFIAPFVHGKVWCKKDKELSGAERVSIATQLGGMLARCAINEDSSAMIDSYVIPRLRYILDHSFVDGTHPQLRARIEDLANQAPSTHVLPLAVIHEDVNSMNIILDDESNGIAALIDWEAASLLPLGSNAWCIRFLATVNRNRIDYETDDTLPMTRGFWTGLVDNLPLHLKGRKDVLEALLSAMQIGLVMFIFWPSYDVIDNADMEQSLKRLNWFEDTLRPMVQ